MRQAPPLKRADRLGLDVELRAIRNGGWRFPAHWHEDLQVIAGVEGRGRVRLDGREVELAPGQLTVIPPGVVHTAGAVGNSEWAFLSLHVTPAQAEHEGVAWTPLVLDAGDPLRVAFDALVASLFARDPDRTDAASAAFGAELLRRRVAAAPSRLDPRLLAARAQLGGDVQADLTLPAVAAAHGFGVRSFGRAFLAAFHMPPHAWRIVARVEAAKRVLRQGRPVAEAARLAGFGDPRHFSRTYRRVTGITARAYADRFRRRPEA